MNLYHAALISESSRVTLAELQPVAAALQRQIAHDVAPFWQFKILVSAFQTRAEIPVGAWPLIIQDNIGEPGAAGFHTDENNQPFALIQYAPDWSVTASHELIEMGGDPFGNTLRVGNLNQFIQPSTTVQFLQELCDPPEAHAYQVNGIKVSDFILPHFYDPDGQPWHKYSFLNALPGPRSIDRGGYLSYLGVDGIWYQLTWFNGPEPTIQTLGKKADFGLPGDSLREAVDRWARLNHPKLGKKKA